MMMLFVCLLVFIILGVHISSTYAISSYFLPFSKSTSNLHHSQDQEQEVTSGNTLSLQYMRHKSDPSKHPLPIPTTEFEVICLKLLAEEAARESQNELAEKNRQSQLELAEKTRQSQEEMAVKNWQIQLELAEKKLAESRKSVRINKTGLYFSRDFGGLLLCVWCLCSRIFYRKFWGRH